MAFFPFDPNGNLASNLIVDEAHNLNSVNGVDHQYMVPRNAPFFDASMVVVDQSSGTILKEGVDYGLGWTFEAGLEEVGVGLSSVVYLIDKNRTGIYKLRYQTLGGDFVTATTRAINDGLAALNQLTVVTWDDIAPGTLPTTWPPTPHTQPVTDVEAVQEIIDAIANVANALISAPPYIRVNDIIDFDENFITPLSIAMSDVADAIRSNLAKTLTYERFVLNQNPDFILEETSDPILTWHDVGISGQVGVDGTYIVDYDLRPLFNAGVNPVYRTRFLISTDNGVTYNDVPDSYNCGAVVGLASGWFIKLQVYFHESYTRAILASDAEGTETSSSMTLLRLGS